MRFSNISQMYLKLSSIRLLGGGHVQDLWVSGVMRHCPDVMLLPVQISVGCVRARFARHIAVLILIDACASALGFYLLGFAFAFGDGQDEAGNLYGNTFIGFKYFALHGADGPQYFATAVRPYAFWVFEWAVSLPPLGCLVTQSAF